MLTLTSFKDRADQQLLIQLTDEQATAVNDVMVSKALLDAWAQIRGYTYRLPAELVPPDDVLEAHQFDLAMYRLAGNRPGTEFESFSARYKASIRFLESLKADPNDRGVVLDVNESAPLFDAGSLTEFGKLVAE